MLPTPPADPSPTRRRPPPWLLAVLVVVLVAAALVAIAVTRDDDRGAELGAGARAGASTTTTTTAEAAATTVSTSPPASVPPTQKRAFDELMRQVADVRGLQWKGPLNLQVVSRAELARRVRAAYARDTDPNQVAAEEATLKVLGLIPADADLAKILDDLHAAAVAGFYDPETKELVVGGETSGELEANTRYVIAHEMTHALTDQVFNYGPATIALDKADKAEESAAYSALLEGDATLTQDLWAEKYLSPIDQLAVALGVGGGGDVSAFLRAPAYIQQALFFPYDEGKAFVEQLHSSGGFAAVDAAYRKPPTSTEHILHPETYRAGQASTPPAVPDVAAATGCRQVRSGMLGEFDMRAVLDEQLPQNDASRAASGWNGDAYRLVRCGTKLGLADRWETDPGADAGRLVDALSRWAPSWSGGGKGPAADGRFSGPNGAGRIVRAGSHVDLVLAQDADTMEKLARALGS